MKTRLLFFVLLSGTLFVGCVAKRATLKTFSMLMLFVICFATGYAQKSASDDGNYSNTVLINTQRWTTDNLNVSQYRNGDSIPYAKTKDEWVKYSDESIGCYTYVQYNSSTAKLLGKLYNWYAVNDQRGLAPYGFHIPSHQDWRDLIDFLSLSMNAMKIESSMLWGRTKVELYEITDKSENNILEMVRSVGKFTNSSGFSALPAGYIQKNGKHWGLGECTMFWSSTETGKSTAKVVNLNTSYNQVNRNSDPKVRGYSVRLLKD